MANEDHLRVLRQGVDVWNDWRRTNPEVEVDLSGAILREANLSGAYLANANLDGASLAGANLGGADLGEATLVRASLSEANLGEADLVGADLTRAHLRTVNLSGADLGSANLSGACLWKADLREARLDEARLANADLRNANLAWAKLVGANLSRADLAEANLSGANLSKANLSGVDLSGANLIGANLTEANLSQAKLWGALLLGALLNKVDLTGCRVFGVSVWGVNLSGAKQTDLVITRPGEPSITVDNLEVAQFVYLLVNNERIRYIIDTITSKVVLILGRFTPERKAILDALREALRGCNYTPVVFDFDRPSSRDLTETVSTLAHLARFVIADITDPRSIPQELQAIVPGLAVPVQPIIARPQQPWGMFVDFPKKYHWVLAPYEYTDLGDLLPDLQAHVIEPAEAKARQLVGR